MLSVAESREEMAVAFRLKATLLMAAIASLLGWIAALFATLGFRFTGAEWPDAFVNGSTAVVVAIALAVVLLGADGAARLTHDAMILFNVDRRFDSQSQKERVLGQIGMASFFWAGLLAVAELVVAMLIVA